ncbi:MAG: hypothetical protein M9928_14715 [Anaerolineae bacterium]|nr:hypothetical protein [Anaerolineae bacterium]MCO5191739.1 hypothetical protein [Anaerolineae bacterium]MCO5206285.1 hypothetical protein [Anaerolineae bacterium]
MSEDYALIDFTNKSKMTLRLSMMAENGREYFVTDVKPDETTMQISPIYTTWNARLMWEIDSYDDAKNIQDLTGRESLQPVDNKDTEENPLPASFTIWARTQTAFKPLMIYKPDPDAIDEEPPGEVATTILTMDWNILIEKGRYRFNISEAGVELIFIHGGFVMPPFN